APGRRARLMEEPRDRDHRARRILRTLDDDGAAGAERGNDLADRLVEREIPRRERGADPDRLLQHELPHALGARCDDAPVDAAAFLGGPLGVLGAHRHLADGFSEWLALVERDVAADLVRTGAGKLAHLAQDT